MKLFFIFLIFFITKIGKKRCKNNTIEDKNDAIKDKKSELDSIIKEFRELITLFKFRFEKKNA